MPRIPLTPVVAPVVLGVVAVAAPARTSPQDQYLEAPVFEAGATLVTVDVVVLDGSGDPIAGLTAEDFNIEDEGVLRRVTRFEAVNLPASPAVESPAVSFVSSNTSAREPSLRTFVVVFDDVHMDPASAQRARDAVWEFVEILREGDRVCLAATSGGAWWYARIPEGRHDLGGALRRLTGRRPRRFAADRMSDYEAMRLHLHRDPQVGDAVTRRYVANDVMFDRPDPNADLMPRASREVRQEVLGPTFSHPLILGRAAEVYYDVLSRKQATYGVLREVAEALEPTRGRKSILFLSEGFIQEPNLPEHRDMVRAAQRSNAVVHFIDVRGLGGLPASADVEMGRPTGGSLADSGDLLDQMNEPLLESLGAISLAVDTGGRVIRNANDLARGLRRLERESRTYYLLGFEPTGVEPDGSFRKLKVSVDRPGIEVLAREGYFAPTSGVEAPAHDDDSLDPRVRLALDSPFDADGIPLRLTSYLLEPSEGRTNVLFVADIDSRGMTFEEKDGRFQDRLTFHLVVSHRDTGVSVHRGHQVDLSLPPAAYDQMRRNRLPLMVDLPLGPGRHQARLLVRDEGSGQIGTVRHDFDVPAPDALRVSTPILTDVIDPASDEDSSLLKPRPLARRTFVSGETVTLLYRVHGADAREGRGPRVTGGFVVESASGGVVASVPVTELPPGPAGEVGQIADISLEDVPAGVYAVVVTARDESSGEAVVTRLPFRVAPPPGTAVLEETVDEGDTEDPLERVRGYLLGWGQTKKE